ncbi:DNA independent RNA polymerase I transcription factor [Linderina macrospora]|uniref:DNA independent RNA polymerase I transcription factor n=1 Tax=Linderina macrospora TaxID=4868 RepID=A0ACC1JHY7_9FUNG|nr:DNA independent RNA polymerase I transcription factor [Linderina macrospora]
MDEYFKLIKVFSYTRNASALTADQYASEVTPWLAALSENVSTLTITYRELINTIFFSDWVVNADERFVHRYATLVIQILSAHPAWVPYAMNSMVRWFSFGSHKGEEGAGMVHERVHAVVREVYRTIPTCGASLAAAIVEKYPFKTAKINVQVVYLQNTLRCLEYAEGVRKEVLAVVLNRVIQVDVEVQVELEDLEEQEAAATEEAGQQAGDEDGVFEFEDDEADTKDDESDSDSDSDSESESDSSDDEDDDDDESNALATVSYDARPIVSKLDAMMNVLFEWLDRHIALDLQQGAMPESASRLFLVILDLFDTIILPTFKSRYTQFLVFFLSAKDPQYADVFLGTMMGKVGDPVRNLTTDRVSTVAKVAAASYLGSFVARAAFISPQIVRNVMGVLVQWANAYLDWQEQREPERSYAQALAPSAANSLHVDFERHAVFYAVTQAVLYLFCFRWRDLATPLDAQQPLDESELDSLRWCPEVEGIQRVVFSKLNPLRACSAAVAQQFAAVASQTNFLFCYALIQQNKRSTSADESDDAAARGSSITSLLRKELDTFFPFDPMALPISRQYIDPIYLEWRSVGGNGDDEDDSDDDGDDDGEPAEGADDDDEEGVVDQMIAMSISPVPPLGAAFLPR